MADKKIYNAVIIGGGASGLLCAVSAKLHNKNINIAIIEKNDRVGKKLLSTGNGRCNLTNAGVSTDYYVGSFKNQAQKLFDRFTTDYLLNIFANLGLICFSDSEGRFYPVSKQASSVLDVLRFAYERLGIDTYCSENIKSVRKANGKFTVTTQNSEFVSDKLVIACGSKAAPKLGGNSSAVDYLRNFGHKINVFSPALCPVIVKSDLLKSLKGLRATGKVTLYDKNNNSVKSESGEIQFTDSSLSGICIFNLSLYTKPNYRICIDLLPNYSDNELYELVNKHISLFSSFLCDSLFTGIFQKRLAIAVLKMSGISDFNRKCSELSKNEIREICDTVKNMSFYIEGKGDFSNAQSSIGGVIGREINESTMESKIVKNLFICGEAVDLCGECGGYNLHFAFSSGYVAGENL